jgi:MoxR-like ATPase
LPEGNDLAPIRDRFLLTHFVNHLSRGNRELLMLRKAGLEPDPWRNPKTRISKADFMALREYTRQIAFTRDVIIAKNEIIFELEKEGIIISERRDGQCQQLMQANALLENRTIVDDDDLLILQDALWMEPGQRSTVSRVVNQHSNPTNARAAELKDQANTIYVQTKMAMETNKQDRSKRLLAASDGAGKLEAIKQELEQLQTQANKAGKTNKRIDQAATTVGSQYAELLKSVGFKNV